MHKLAHYLRKIYQLGPRESHRVIAARFSSWIFDNYWRTLAHQQRASHTWSDVAHALEINHQQEDFVETLLQKQEKFLALRHQVMPRADVETLTKQADFYAAGYIDLLGSGPCHFDEPPWHTDFRLAKEEETKLNPLALSARACPAKPRQSRKSECIEGLSGRNFDITEIRYSFSADLFFKDIQISGSPTESLSKDIKIPWELSRLQHFFILGYAYYETKNENYYHTFISQLSSWQKHNPFLLGTNWVCPMDVGIRAINLIWALFFFADQKKPQSWIPELVCLLYDHLVYLEHTWEIYDGRTSNHYLSDLVGYLYCCAFFSDGASVQQKFLWCQRELVAEMEKQVFPEGTDYEGSTRYHGLVTELFYHGALISNFVSRPLPASYSERLQKMFDFIQWCTISDAAFITVGDDDSGKVVCGITKNLLAQKSPSNSIEKKEFPKFGISIIKTEDWHVSLRHHAYQARQPSGHFHNDVGSITVSYKGQSIFVDPGSYVYTPSAVWRNKFRSVEIHNTFWVDGIEPVPLDDRLFSLTLPENEASEFSDTNFSLVTSHDLYANFGLRAHRSVDLGADGVVIRDWWEHRDNSCQNIRTRWNFTLAEDVDATQLSHGILLTLPNKQKILFSCAENMTLNIVSAWVSLRYGSKRNTRSIYAQKMISSEVIVLRLIIG
jgi:hypothetical protein